MTEHALERVGRTNGFRFCGEPACDVVYFQRESGVTIPRAEVRVRVGKKETELSRPVCYCFGHTAEEIEVEGEALGTSKIAEDIAEKCRRGLDRCEETNPQGSCCLGDVARIVRVVLARRGSAASSPRLQSVATMADCCTTDKERSE